MPLRCSKCVSRPMDDDCFHGSGQDQLTEMSIEDLRKKASPVEREERMVRVFLDDEDEKGVKTLAKASMGTIQQRCSRCGLEWDSAHDAESCPLEELEISFLSADWFMVFGESTS